MSEIKNILIVEDVSAINDFKKERVQRKKYVLPDIPFDDVKIQLPMVDITGKPMHHTLDVFVRERFENSICFDITFDCNYLIVYDYYPNSLYEPKIIVNTFDEMQPKAEVAFRNSIFNCVTAVFDYILNHSVTVIEKQTVCKKERSKNVMAKSKHKCRYITTTKYIITGCEKRKRSAPTYALEQWSVRGFYRTYKSGKKIFIKPSCRQRRCNNGHMGEISQAPTVYKI